SIRNRPQHLLRRKVLHHLQGRHAQRAIGRKPRLHRRVVNLPRLKLLRNPLFHAHGEHPVHISRPGPKRQPVQRMNRPLALVHPLHRRSRWFLAVIPGEGGQGGGGQQEQQHKGRAEQPCPRHFHLLRQRYSKPVRSTNPLRKKKFSIRFGGRCVVATASRISLRVHSSGGTGNTLKNKLAEVCLSRTRYRKRTGATVSVSLHLRSSLSIQPFERSRFAADAFACAVSAVW